MAETKIKEYQVVGRKRPSETQPEPPIYRMRIFARDEVKAKSRFWYFLSRFHKMKRTTGEILAVDLIPELDVTTIKNYAIWIRYDSRSGTHNLYKEFRDVSRVGAVAQMYDDMASRHRGRAESIQIIDIKTLTDEETKRPNIKEFHTEIKFPLIHRRLPAPRFCNRRPQTAF
mmetsp:Transcript_24446/g.40189  ORF Transcript_24446/g.40189 Transcript_24446/m.40189 type:complete len:172 (-) Transcript_24446:83-598(-)|eukprot:CAMPEP_0184656874 /NCGR_PEP_ID=MMETSP0308-20130426/16816_1 /TAXON_ID=38269 /ORGANISM="Gloeochaete witrockiana, Strain SAG 46.84" /LENGTH=171 /DNA_ID=CAMNT_0027094185 /DNA_START=18 /DNA_END=533 /DNA_ORIENTATION=-